MPLSVIYWILWLLYVVLGGVAGWRGKDYWIGGGSLLLAALLFVVGLRLFGPIVNG